MDLNFVAPRIHRSGRLPNFLLPGLAAFVLTACAVAGAPPHASIYPKDHHELASDPRYVLDVDFERRNIRIEIQGSRYAGKLVGIANYNALQSRLVASDGDWMQCVLNQVLPEVWDGQCTDSGGRVYDLKVGHGWSV